MLILNLLLAIYPTSSLAASNVFRSYRGHTSTILDIALHPGNNYTLFTASDDRTVKQWNIQTGLLERTFANHSLAVRAVSVSSDGLFTGSSDRTVKLWDVETGTLLQTYSGHTAIVTTVFAFDGMLFSGGGDFRVIQWDIQNGGIVCEFQGHTGLISSITARDKRLYSASIDMSIREWNITSCQLLNTFTGHTGGVSALYLRGDYLYSGSYDKSVFQWSLSSGVHQKMAEHTEVVNSIVVTDNYAYSSSKTDYIIRWNIAQSTSSGLLSAYGANSIAYSESRKRLFATSTEQMNEYFEGSCDIGTGLNETSASCEPCPIGTYKSFAAGSPCVDCPVYAECLSTGLSNFKCAPGYTLKSDKSGCSNFTRNDQRVTSYFSGLVVFLSVLLMSPFILLAYRMVQKRKQQQQESRNKEELS